MDETPVTVTAVREVGPDTIAIDLETPPEFEAVPGQFVKLVVTVDDGTESRFYTISSPHVGDSFELTIGIDPEGDVSPQLRELGVGDEVVLAGPYGSSYYEGEEAVCLVAGGPGIGPAIGIAERALDDGGDATLIYRDDSPVHEDRLKAAEGSGAFVRILGESEPLEGAIEAGLESVGGAGRAQVFVYGFAEFLDDAVAALSAAGSDPDRAKVENFG